MKKAMVVLAHGSKVEATKDVAFKIRDDIEKRGIRGDYGLYKIYPKSLGHRKAKF
jgi:hypothetical protein